MTNPNEKASHEDNPITRTIGSFAAAFAIVTLLFAGLQQAMNVSQQFTIERINK